MSWHLIFFLMISKIGWGSQVFLVYSHVLCLPTTLPVLWSLCGSFLFPFELIPLLKCICESTYLIFHLAKATH